MIWENNTRIAAIDLGNSKVKILLDGRNITLDYKGKWVDIIANILLDGQSSKVFAGISSVRPEKLDELKKIREINENIVFFKITDEVSKLNDSIKIAAHGVGADRLMGLYGALLYASPPLFTVDCGTAITVNFLDSSCVFRGGAILPGIGTQLRALHEFTEQLPLPAPTSPAAYIGTATEAAVVAGVVGGAGGAVRTLIEKMWREANDAGTPVVVITGGEAEILLPELSGWSFPVQYYQHIVREGILSATRRVIEHKHKEHTP